MATEKVTPCIVTMLAFLLRVGRSGNAEQGGMHRVKTLFERGSIENVYCQKAAIKRYDCLPSYRARDKTEPGYNPHTRKPSLLEPYKDYIRSNL